jgi:P-type Ca2+ transporter type 2C
VAMGGRGAAMARDLADVVLMDDDFASIAAAVEQGRTIQANIRKALRFLLATNLSEIILTVGALLLGMAQPLSAFHLLWINLITDVLPALGLAVESAEAGVMREPPADPREPILSRDALGSIVRDAALMGLGSLGAYAMALGRYGPGPRASTVAFSTITMAQLAYALGCRSEERSALEGLGRSKTLLGTIGGTAGLQAGTVIVPALRALLGTTPLAFSDLALVAAGAGVPVAACEVLKARRPAPGRGGGHEGHG